MAVSTTNAVSGPYVANGVTTSFPITFKLLDAGGARVTLTVDEVEGEIAPTEFATVINEGGNGGSVVFGTAPAVGDLRIYSEPAFIQEAAFSSGQRFSPAAVNDALDRAAIRDQYLLRKVNAAVDAIDAGIVGDVRSDLASPAPGKGASLIGFSHDATYAAGTIGASLQRTVFVTDPPYNAVAGVSTPTQARLNRAAFNAAIAFLHDAGGGELRVPAGEFHVAGEAAPALDTDKYIYLRGGVHIVGDGMDSTRLVRASSWSLFTNSLVTGDDYTSNGTDFRIARLTLDGNPAAQASPSNFIYLSNATGILIEDVRFLDCPGLHGLDLNGVKDINVERCRFEGHDHALSLAYGGATYVPEAIQLAFITSPSHAPVPTVGVTVEKCYFGPSANLSAPKVSIGNHTAYLGAICSNIVVEKCTMEGMTNFGARPFCWDGATFRSNLFIGCAHGIYVTSAFDTYDGAGVATGVPQSNANIVIDGNRFIDIVTGPPIGLSEAGGANVTSYAQAKRVTIVNNIIVDTTPQGSIALFFLAWADGLTVSGNKHTGSRGRSVQMRFCSNASISDNVFDTSSSDAVTVNESGGANENGWAASGISNRIAFTGNRMKGAAFYGMNFAGALSGLTVTGNKISGIGSPNPRPGIVLQSGIAGAILADNMLDGSNGGMTIGIDVKSGCTAVTIGENQISGATVAPHSHAGTGRLNTGGNGTPENVIAAPRGSLWAREDGGAGSSLYIKESGVGATGWAAK